MTDTYLLPGMGAASEMYGKEIRAVKGVKLIDWPKYTGQQTIEDLAESILEQNKITEMDLIGGSSLGGIVALEISKITKVQGVILIGSCLDTSEINGSLKFFSGMINYAPIKLTQHLLRNSKNEILRMFANTDAEFLKKMSEAVFTWEGYKGSLQNIYRIHGGRDKIIRCEKSKCDHYIETAGHLIAYTHGKEVAKFLEEVIEKKRK